MSDPGNPQQVPPEGPQGSSPAWQQQPPPDPAAAYGTGPDLTGYGMTAGPPAEALAGFWVRFAGALIDGILLSVVGNVLAAIVGARGAAGGGVSFVLGAAYFTYFHGSAAAQTIGQKAVNIRVADVGNGGGVDYGRAFIRFLVSYVSGLAIALGYLWMLWDPRNQTWHDKAANTLVVKTQYYPPPGEFGKPAS